MRTINSRRTPCPIVSSILLMTTLAVTFSPVALAHSGALGHDKPLSPVSTPIGPASLIPLPDHYVPAATPVAVLVLNETQGGWDAMKTQEDSKGEQQIEMRFQQRGFPVVDDVLVSKTLADMNLDLQALSQQPPDTLVKTGTIYQIGHAVRARLVVLLAITDTRSGNHFSLGGGFHKEGGATVKIWLVDAAAGQPIIADMTKSSKTSGTPGFGLIGPAVMAGTGGSSLSIRAIGGAADAALKPFIKDYPVTNASVSDTDATKTNGSDTR